ncbi:MAG: flagellin, partial [Rhodospirillaceae bacterium]
SLLSLTNTASLMSRTQGRLTSGMKVASAIDDAVAYFQAKGLDDRASDFSIRKDEIDQGISSVKAALNSTSTVDSVLKQMKGIVNSARTADMETKVALTSQFKDLAKQITSAVSDASYQGMHLVDNSSSKLTVYFNENTSAQLTVKAQNLKSSSLLTAAAGTGGFCTMLSAMMKGTQGLAVLGGFSSVSKAGVSSATALNNISAKLDKAISKVRSVAAQLGGNVTFLQTRMDFTTNYINTMQEGSGKLTLADLNNEGANLVALQTRQQIGVQSLSIAGQQQQSILSLLR